MAEYIVNLDCSEPIRQGDVNTVVIVHNKIERIVRCRDCKHCNFESKCTKFAFDNGVVFYAHKVEPDGFCAWGDWR